MKTKSVSVLGSILVVVLIAGCSTPGDTSRAAKPRRAVNEAQAAPAAATATVDLTHLPVGNRVVSSPQIGGVYSCLTSFKGGGAFNMGGWFNSDGTYNLTAKPAVDGSVTWPSQFSITLQGGQRVISGNDLPDHPTGNYPIAASDDAYHYDHNPNSIKAQTLKINLPANPAIAAQPSCLPGGPVGVMLSGAYFFNALDAAGRDAVAYEIQDGCGGHPERQGAYHYHSVSDCVPGANQPHALIGYAFDGFGIYSPLDEKGNPITNADLDACHGHTGLINWDGKMVEMYHYHATYEYPYTLGCYKGTSAVRGPQGNQQGGPAGGAGGQPGGPGGAGGPGGPGGPPPAP
jgi:hypothetical protein